MPSSCLQISCIIVGTALIVALLLLFLFRYYQLISTHATLQGYWHIEDDIYLVINNNVMQVVDLTQQTTYEDSHVDFNYASIFGTTGHTFLVKRSPKATFACLSANHPLNAEIVLFDLYPVCGIMHLKNGDKISILTKDNQMSRALLEEKQ